MSDELRKLEDRLNSKLELQFELFNQGMTLLRDNVSRRFEAQEQQFAQLLQHQQLHLIQLLQTALAAQRSIIEDAMQQQQELTNRSFAEIRKAITEAFASPDVRVTRLEKKAG